MEKFKALIVDDEEMIRRGIARIIAGCGEEWEVVGTMADGQEALDYLHEHQGDIDLLITDVRMPVMDGLALIQEANHSYQFESLIISGYDDFEYVQTAMREGALDYLLKPIDREQFRERLSEIQRKIEDKRNMRRRWQQLEKQTEQLKYTRQIQLLTYVTSTGLDISRLGYWVEEFPRGCHKVLYISLDAIPMKARTFSAKDWGAFDYVVENIIGELMHDVAGEHAGNSWCWRGEQSDHWAMLQLPNPEDEERLTAAVHDAADRIRKAIRQYTPFTVSIAASDPFQDLYMLPEAARQARSLIHYRLILGGNQLFVSQIAGGAVDENEQMLDPEMMHIGQRICEAIERNKEDAARRWLKELFHKLQQQTSPLNIQRCVQGVYLAVQMSGIDQELDEERIEEGLRAIRRAPNLQEMCRIVDHAIRTRLELVASRRNAANMGPVEQAKAWIAERLHEEISIKRIADHVFMSPSYFCRYFKMQTGETILDCITRMRMERAKDLLADPGIKIQEVSLLVGYQDVKYFSRLFKEWTSDTPSQYRKQILQSMTN